MPTNVKISAAARNAAVDKVVALFHQHAVATFQIYTGPPPLSPGGVPTGTQIVSGSIATPIWTAASGGQAQLLSARNAAAVNSGIAGYFRFFDALGSCHLQGTAGEVGDAPDLVLGVKSIVSGSTIRINTFNLQMPE